MEWYEAVERLTPHVVQIATPQGSGTGFLLWRSKTSPLHALATAAHVIDHAHFWEQPIRVRVPITGQVALLRSADRAIIVDREKDTAVVLFEPADLTLPENPVNLITRGNVLKVGVPVGWLGFPAIPAADLCFFMGSVSAWVESHSAYFVDGVAINGVSGGPAFSVVGDAPCVIGVVSAYMPNRATGEALPGLGIVRDVAQFHDAVQNFASLDEARAEQTPPSDPPPAAPSPPQSVPSGSRRGS